MKRTQSKGIFTGLISVCLLLFAVATVSGEEYAALKGVNSIKAVFDVRIDNLKSADLHLKLIQQTLKDKGLTSITKKPDFVVVFVGSGVKLVSKQREAFSPENQKILDSIGQTISAMSKDGIRLEVCLVAAKVFGIDPANFLPEIKRVGNGFISLIGYQARGYSLVPVY